MEHANDNFNSGDFDLKSLQLPQNFAQMTAVKKIITNVPIRKSNGREFYRVHSDLDWRMPVYLYQVSEEQESFVVLPQVAPLVIKHIFPAVLRIAINQDEVIFVIPLRLPGLDERPNTWHESRSLAVAYAEVGWVQTPANMARKAYDVNQPLDQLPEPRWPEMGPQEIFKIALRGKVVDTEDHPVVRKLVGRL